MCPKWSRCEPTDGGQRLEAAHRGPGQSARDSLNSRNDLTGRLAMTAVIIGFAILAAAVLANIAKHFGL